MALMLTAMLSAPAWAAPRFAAADGQARDLRALAGRPAILVFWRSDCGPCLNELRGLAGLEAAAGQVPLVLVALEPRATAAPALARLGASPKIAWTARDDARRTLLAFSPPPARLPLAVALRASGAVCARRVGMLGADRVRTWVRQCS